MSDETNNNFQQPVWHIGVIFFAVCFLGAVLVVVVQFSKTTPAIDANRDATISKSLAEIRKTEAVELNYPAWADQSRGLVRLPIETAMEVTAREWKNPAQARADLIARAEKAAAPAPKTAAPASNPYE